MYFVHKITLLKSSMAIMYFLKLKNLTYIAYIDSFLNGTVSDLVFF